MVSSLIEKLLAFLSALLEGLLSYLSPLTWTSQAHRCWRSKGIFPFTEKHKDCIQCIQADLCGTNTFTDQDYRQVRPLLCQGMSNQVVWAWKGTLTEWALLFSWSCLHCIESIWFVFCTLSLVLVLKAERALRPLRIVFAWVLECRGLWSVEGFNKSNHRSSISYLCKSTNHLLHLRSTLFL